MLIHVFKRTGRDGGSWVAQQVRHPSLYFSSGHDCGFEPRIGAWSLPKILSLSPLLPLPLPCCPLSLSLSRKKSKLAFLTPWYCFFWNLSCSLFPTLQC